MTSLNPYQVGKGIDHGSISNQSW